MGEFFIEAAVKIRAEDTRRGEAGKYYEVERERIAAELDVDSYCGVHVHFITVSVVFIWKRTRFETRFVPLE